MAEFDLTVPGGLFAQPDGTNAAQWMHWQYPADEMILPKSSLLQGTDSHADALCDNEGSGTPIHIIIQQSDFQHKI